jgi:hypothetical protein
MLYATSAIQCSAEKLVGLLNESDTESQKQVVAIKNMRVLNLKIRLHLA